MKRGKHFEFNTKFNPIDMLNIAKEIIHEIEFDIYPIGNQLIFKYTDINISLPALDGDIKGNYSALGCVINRENFCSKSKTFEERLNSDYSLFKKASRLKRIGDLEGLEELKKNTKWFSYDEQEKLYNHLKKKLAFKPKDKVTNEDRKKFFALKDRIPKIESGFGDIKKRQFYVINDIGDIISNNLEDKNEKLISEYIQMRDNELNKPKVRDELELMKKEKNELEEKLYENYLFIKDLDGNIIDTRKEFEMLKSKNLIKGHYYIYNKEDVIKKLYGEV